MSKNVQQQVQPLAPATTFTHSDEEGRASPDAKAMRRNKIMKCLLYVVIFAIFQVGVIALFALTIAKFRNPRFRARSARCLLYVVIFAIFLVGVITLSALTIAKFRNPKFCVRSATFETFKVAPATNGSGGPSFDIQMNAELGVKNTNFGNFRYRNSMVKFYYRDSYKVGEAFIDRARAKARSTRKFNLTVDLSSRNVTENSNLGTDIGRGILPLRSRSRLRGSVKIMVILKKNRIANMDCTMDLVISFQQLQNVIYR